MKTRLSVIAWGWGGGDRQWTKCHTFSMVSVSCGNNLSSCKVDELSSCVNCQHITHRTTVTATHDIQSKQEMYLSNSEIKLQHLITQVVQTHIEFTLLDISKKPQYASCNCWSPTFGFLCVTLWKQTEYNAYTCSCFQVRWNTIVCRVSLQQKQHYRNNRCCCC